ncbi:MAG: hypothetical protein BWK80_57820 [Desulfobacteraceae bacterium IS3]|nr:MAG: hypothetical protein BWK80_57820 [Desulfobacteraceae bacterium IS3]
MNFEKCSEDIKKKIIAVSENTRKFEIRNDNSRSVNKVRVDGCLIDDNRERCDYLFEIDKLVIYVELKGSDIQKAYNQLIATIGYCKHRHDKSVKECYIVASRVPRAGTDIQTLKKKMANTHKIQLFVKTQKAEVHL